MRYALHQGPPLLRELLLPLCGPFGPFLFSLAIGSQGSQHHFDHLRLHFLEFVDLIQHRLGLFPQPLIFFLGCVKSLSIRTVGILVCTAKHFLYNYNLLTNEH